MKTFLLTTAIAALSCIGVARATALPATCGHVSMAASQPHGAGSLSGHGYDLSLAGDEDRKFHATDIAATGTGLDPQALRDMEDVASLVMLATLTGHHSEGCAQAYFTAAATPIMEGLRASLRMVPGQGGKHDEGGHVLHIPQGLGVKARARGRDVGRVELPVLVTRKRQVIAMSGQGTGPMGLAGGHANMATGCGQGGCPRHPDAGQGGDGGGKEECLHLRHKLA